MIAGNYLYNKQRVTHGDVGVISAYGILGGFYPIVILNSFDIEESRAYIAGAMLGSAAGIAGGIYRTNNYDYSRQQSFLIAVGEAAGGLVGAGFGVLFEAKHKGYLWLTALGATGGLLLSDNLLRESSQSKSESTSNIKLQFNPYNNPYKPWDPRYSNSLFNFNLLF
jgi:hypothetical protein